MRRSRRGAALRTIATVVVLIVIVAFILGAMEVFAALTSSPAITVDHGQRIHDRTLDRHRADRGPGENQWPRFRTVLDLVEQGAQDFERRNEAYQPGPDDAFPYIDFWIIRSPYEDPQRDALPDLPGQYEKARQRGIDALDHWYDLGVFEASRAVPTLDRVAMPPLEQPSGSAPIPEFGLARHLFRAQVARMRLAAQAGDDAERVGIHEESLALARIMADSGTMLGWLTAKAMDTGSVRLFLDDHFLFPITSEATLAATDAAVVRELVDRYPTLDAILENERDVAYDYAQRVYTSQGRFIPLAHARLQFFDLSQAPDRLLPVGDTSLSNIHARVFLSHKDATAWIDEAHRFALAAANASGADAQAADDALAAHDAVADWRNPVAEVNLEPHNVIGIHRRYRIEVAGLRVMLAIERYRLRHGRLPPTLEALGDLLPQSLRTDPFTGQPWRYAPTAQTTGWNGEPLTSRQSPWPYSLSSRPLPGLEHATPPHPNHAAHGVQITMPVALPIERWPRDAAP